VSRDLEKMIANREFRSDLYYRLNVFPIRIPALRERKEDIPQLVSYYVQKFSRKMGKNIGCVPAVVMRGLVEWEWPGNVRELENFIERSVILTRGRVLEVPLSDLRTLNADRLSEPTVQRRHNDIAQIVKETIESLNGKRNIAEEHAVKREEIVRVLTETRGRVGGANGAAARMSVNRTTLLSRMKRFGIDRRNFA
jgi:formate hydrogenlyase transcriptional activator